VDGDRPVRRALIGPILRRLSPVARAEFTARFMPATVLLMPTLVLMTLAAGFQLALDLGNLSPASPNHGWLVASYCVVGVMAVIALGVLSPANRPAGRGPGDARHLRSGRAAHHRLHRRALRLTRGSCRIST
jgi:hypothetical protein